MKDMSNKTLHDGKNSTLACKNLRQFIGGKQLTDEALNFL
jgi:hypothetical protein